MSTPDEISIKYADDSQGTEALQEVAAEVSKILTTNEEILYIALQNITALSLKKDSAVATTNRFILYRPSVLGRVEFDDFQWQDLKNVKIDQGLLASDINVETIDGRTATLGGIDKEQAKRLYSVTQQMEQEWREKRRIREMEEARAQAGGIQFSGFPGGSAGAPGAEDPVEKLAKAKAMLDQKLITEAEYDSLKAKILSSM